MTFTDGNSRREFQGKITFREILLVGVLFLLLVSYCNPPILYTKLNIIILYIIIMLSFAILFLDIYPQNFYTLQHVKVYANFAYVIPR